eukprot:TRINITY_DN6511_c0_g3_i1.p1 TRINITY_DN6511_c0_g3~~TRINITY_DN6511_c0_g3_i1.p1  ORF type:complete len:532 (+),score=234.59 TRINITY_DN6511_c0_g3_i1:88-1683(+)
MLRNIDSRRKNFKKGIDVEENRRRREETTIELRKAKREEQIHKRRLKSDGQATDDQEENFEFGSIQDPSVQQQLRNLPALVLKTQSADQHEQLEAVQTFRKLLSIERNPPINEVIASGVVPILVVLLAHPEPLIQFEASWALTNIASGTSEHTKVVIDHGAIPYFINLLRSSDDDVREQAVWALGNIAGDSPIHRDLVLRHGALPQILALCQPNSKISLLRNATWATSNMCRGKPQPTFEMVSICLPVLAQLLFVHDDEVVTDACWALSYLSDDTGGNNSKIQAVISSGVCRRLIELLGHKSTAVKTPALRAVGNIVTGDDLQTQVMLHLDVLKPLLHLLQHQKRGLRKEACWTISNITAGNAEQIEAVLNANLVPPLVHLMRTAEFDVRKEACWAISNATSGGTDDQIRRMVEQACIPQLCEMLKCKDKKMVKVAMEAIENILKSGKNVAEKKGLPRNEYTVLVEECGGVDTLEQLQELEDEDIFVKASQVITNYFGGEPVGEDDVLKPATTSTGFTFSVNSNNNNFSFQ